ncbi:MAG TPA: Tim44/TimA family putative adaptor protein [Acetobacteraceae bacterium]|jgi:predicted lipid-binding transport protein (Tim44 family)|nr:Tim44/TimA family putative adaptor protein [Acetobacteraceae bacterium]
MGGSGSFPIELILFGMIAAFLVLRLRSILGRRQGFERPPDATPNEALFRAGRVRDPRTTEGPVIDVPAEPVSSRAVPDPESPVGATLRRMQQIDPHVDPARFLDGAEAAFRIIVEAYAAGDRVKLQSLLSDDTYRAFEGSIAARETAGETQRTEIKSVHSATIDAADLRGSEALITVRFLSDQVNVTLNREGAPVTGTDAVTEITDLWTFERELGTRDPAWRLVSARSA